MKRNVKIIVGVITCTIGLGLILSNYYLTLKHEVFDDMNRLYYQQNLAINEAIDEINNETVIEEEEPSLEEDNISDIPPVDTNTQTQIESYIGYIRIPKIDLNRGFYSINSKLNNVNKNIYVHPASTFPSNNNNLILASHSGNSSISYFKNLYKLELKDDIYITYDNKEYHYQVTNIYNVSKNGTVGLKINQNVSTVSLITCTKNDKNSQTIYISELVKE